MKSFTTVAVLLVALTSLISNVMGDENYDKIFENCQIESEVPENERDQSLAVATFDVKNASNQVRCAHKCFAEKLKMIENGKINADMIRHFLPQANAEHVRQVVEKCNRENGIDECDSSFQKSVCVRHELGLVRPQD